MAPGISLTNLLDGEVLTYPLAILRGKSSPPHRFIHISSSSQPTASCIYPIVDGHFTALYELLPGPNTIHLSHSSPTLQTPTSAFTLTLAYHPPPPSTPPYVRLVYLLAADSDGSFQSPDGPTQSDLSAGVARLHTAGRMIQSATAEMMHAHGFSRRTFRLHPTVHVHRLSDLPLSRALTMSGMDLWSHIVNALRHLPHRADTIDVAVMSFSRLINGHVKAHTALGGGALALFGGASLFSWPANVSQIGQRLRDSRLFDSRKFFDDSAGRAHLLGRRACTATTIGACLHELGHCLSLPHPTADAERDGGGMMARGFDQFDRLFVLPDKPAPPPFWDRGSAVRLRYHCFLQFEAESEMRRIRNNLRISVSPAATPAPAPRSGALSGGLSPPNFVKGSNGIVVCKSSVGIGHVGYYKNGDNASHEEFGELEPKEFRLPPLTELRRKCRASASDKLILSAIDVEGRITDKPYDNL